MKRLCCSSSRLRSPGFTLIELLVGAGVSLLVIGCFVQYLSHVSRATGRQQADLDAGSPARASMDDMLLYLRGGKTVLPSLTVGSTTYTTDGTDLAFEAPSYDPNTTTVVIENVYDRIVFDYDADRREIRQTIIPGAGSIRPARQDFLIARNVASIAYTFAVREQFTASKGNQFFTLGATPISKPLVLINGQVQEYTYAAETRTVAVNVAVSKSDVQILYTVAPADTAGLSLVTQINIQMTFETRDGVQQVRRVVMPGSARLRNRRS